MREVEQLLQGSDSAVEDGGAFGERYGWMDAWMDEWLESCFVSVFQMVSWCLWGGFIAVSQCSDHFRFALHRGGVLPSGFSTSSQELLGRGALQCRSHGHPGAENGGRRGGDAVSWAWERGRLWLFVWIMA